MSLRHAAVATSRSAGASQAYADSLTNIKLNSATVGGLANGIGGLGAGIVAAVNNEVKNAEIDVQRKNAKLEAEDAKIEMHLGVNSMFALYDQIIQIISNYTQLYQIYDSSYSQIVEKVNNEKELKKKIMVIAGTIDVILWFIAMWMIPNVGSDYAELTTIVLVIAVFLTMFLFETAKT